MSLEFKNFKKKIGRKKFLEINFFLNKNESLALIDENISNLTILKEVFSKKTKYDGCVKILNKDINDIEYYPFFDNKIGFYSNLSIIKNFKLLLSLYNINIVNEEINYYFDLIGANSKDKYLNISDDKKLNLKILFSYLVSTSCVLIDMTNMKITKSTKLFLKKLIDLSKEDMKNIVILSKDLNSITNNCDKALVISDGKQVYYDYIRKLDVIKELIVLETSGFTEEELYKNLLIDFKIIDNKLIIKKEDMENVLYYLVSNNIDVININDFNENTKLYSDKE